MDKVRREVDVYEREPGYWRRFTNWFSDRAKLADVEAESALKAEVRKKNAEADLTEAEAKKRNAEALQIAIKAAGELADILNLEKAEKRQVVLDLLNKESQLAARGIDVALKLEGPSGN